MPFKRIEYRDLNMFYVCNPDPRQMAIATHDNLPQSNPLNPDKPCLVFVHAAGANCTSWTKQMGDPRIANSFNVIAMDCRFHGFTTGGERKSHTLENSAECVMALLDALDLPSYSLYCEGVHGANVGAWIATKRPEKVTALLLASPGFMKEAPHVVELLKSVQQELLINKPGHGGDDTGTFPPEANDQIAAYFIGSSPRVKAQREEMTVRFQKRYGTGHSAHDVGYLFSCVYNRQPIPVDLLAKITCPVMVIRGGDDAIVCPEEACNAWRRAFVNAKGGAQEFVVSGAPSLISLSDSNVLNRVIMQFVQRATAGK